MLLKTQEWLQKPARRQVTDTSQKDAAYVEGNYDYNIWYDKYLTDRQVKQKRMPSLYKCDPEKDAGYTKAEKKGWFCVYFARGCCSEGTNCRYFHRIPNHDDCEQESDNLKDVFGRTRHASFKDDHTGVGCFNKECKTLFLQGIALPTDVPEPTKEMTAKLYGIFSVWGEIEDIAIS